MIVYLGVSNFQRAISIVIPRSRSAFNLSSTQAGRIEDQTICDSEGVEEDERTILEGTLAELGSLLLELLNGTLVDTTALVDQMTSSGGFAGIDVSDDCIYAPMVSDQAHQQRQGTLERTDDIDVGLLLSHFGF